MLELWPGNDGVAVHCPLGTRAMSDSDEEDPFPSKVLRESAGDCLMIGADRTFGVEVAADEDIMEERTWCSIPKSGFKQGKHAPTMPRHICA